MDDRSSLPRGVLIDDGSPPPRGGIIDYDSPFPGALWAREGGRGVRSLSPLSPYPLVPQADGAAAADLRFGIDFVGGIAPATNQPYSNLQTRYQKAVAAGARWTRWPLYWFNIEKTRGQFDWAAHDTVVAADVEHGLQTNAILLGTPGWSVSTLNAFAAPVALPFQVGRRTYTAAELVEATGATPGDVPQGLDKPVFLPDGSINPENTWARFVYTVVSRYKPGGTLAQQRGWAPGQGVTIWELWNEPDLLAGSVPVFWRGGPTQYFLLLKVGYLAAKAADSKSTVLFAGLAYWSQPGFLPRVLDLVAADPSSAANGRYFDVLPWHFYVNPQHITNFADWARSEMQKRGFTRPIWVNEANIPVCGDPQVEQRFDCPGSPSYFGTIAEQANYVIQAYALATAANVERVSIFQLYDDFVGSDTYREYYGLLRNNLAAEPRPAYAAFKTAVTYFANPTSAVRQQVGKLDVVTLFGTPRGKVTVVWNYGATATTYAVPAVTTVGRLVTPLGAETTVTPANGFYRLTLPAATHRDPGPHNPVDLGGEPAILIEAGPLAGGPYVAGRVTDNRGLPIASATITTTGLVTQTAATDSAGRYLVLLPAPGTLTVTANAVGYAPVPGRRLEVAAGVDQHHVLPPADGPLLANWGFESSLSAGGAWQSAGQVVWQSAVVHSGNGAVWLGRGDGSAGESTLRQGPLTLTVGTTNPTVSLFYRVDGEAAAGDTLTVTVATDAGTVAQALAVARTDWRQVWVALPAGARTADLTVRYRAAAGSRALVYLDEVSLGSGRPFFQRLLPLLWRGTRAP